MSLFGALSNFSTEAFNEEGNKRYQNAIFANGIWQKRKEPVGEFVVKIQDVDGKTYLNYISNTIRFKCDWKKKLFSTSYTVASEMVVTDKREGMLETIPNKEAFSLNQIFYDKVDEYWSPDFWGNYNIIEPTESLEHAVDKLKKQSN